MNTKDLILDSVMERRKLVGKTDKFDQHLVSQAEAVYNGFRHFRNRRARVTNFIYVDQWGDPVTVNGKTMTQREYLVKQGLVPLQANLMATKANSIVGSHIKENTVPTLHARKRSLQQTIEVLSEALASNWDVNDMGDLITGADFELLFGGLAVMKESFEKLNGDMDAVSRLVNPNLFAFSSSMLDSRMNDMNMTVELHEYSPNEFYAAFVHSPEDFKKISEWIDADTSPLKFNDEYDVNEKLDQDRVLFRYPSDTKNIRVIEIWTKERRARYHIFDPATADFYDINADDQVLLDKIKKTNEYRLSEAKRLGFDKNEAKLIQTIFFIDTYWYCRFVSPNGYVLYEGESELPNREHPYTICATPFVNGIIAGHMADAVDLQLAINRELVIYDWMKRIGAKGVTFVPQSIIPDGMSYSQFAEQWTSMDGIVFYKPNQNGEKPFVEHGSMGNLNTAEMVKMLADTMADSVSVTGAIQGKTPYAGTSAALYAQQKENSTTPIAVVSGKLETFIKHVALKKTRFIQLYYNVNQYADIADSMDNLDVSKVDFSQIGNIENKIKIVMEPDGSSSRQESNELLLSLFQMGQMNIADVLDLGDFKNADNIIDRLNMRAQEMEQQQQMQIGADYAQKREMFGGGKQQ